jgi:hypothetical protein
MAFRLSRRGRDTGRNPTSRLSRISGTVAALGSLTFFLLSMTCQRERSRETETSSSGTPRPSAALPPLNSVANATACDGLPPFGGCEDINKNWWFDRKLNRCEPFKNEGCLGPGNVFRTLVDCRATCGGAVIAPEQGCPTQIPSGACSGVERSCLYDVTTHCRCREFTDNCNADPTCRPNTVQEKLVRRCRETQVAEDCRRAEPFMGSIPWSCSCRNEHWSCSRLDTTERGYVQIRR